MTSVPSAAGQNDAHALAGAFELANYPQTPYRVIINEAIELARTHPLTVVAGTLGEPFWRFMVMVSVAKGGRYLVLAGAVWAAGFQGGGG